MINRKGFLDSESFAWFCLARHRLARQQYSVQPLATSSGTGWMFYVLNIGLALLLYERQGNKHSGPAGRPARYGTAKRGLI